MFLVQWMVSTTDAFTDVIMGLLTGGRYPYPIFEQLSTTGRAGLFSLSAVVMAMSTITLKWLHGRVNGFGTSLPPLSRPGDIKRKEGL